MRACAPGPVDVNILTRIRHWSLHPREALHVRAELDYPLGTSNEPTVADSLVYVFWLIYVGDVLARGQCTDCRSWCPPLFLVKTVATVTAF